MSLTSLQRDSLPPPGPELKLTRRAASAPEAVPAQTRRDFDAALRRADTRAPQPERRHDEHADDPAPEGLAGALMPAPAALGAAALGGDVAPLSGAARLALAEAPPASTAEAMPTSTGAGVERLSASQQWRLSVPVDPAAGSALALRLVNTGMGHWQLRLSTDNHTRQQLSPHLERLRDRLRQHSGGRFDALGFEDEQEPTA